MKKALLLTLTFLTTLSLQAELNYTSFGIGWSIGLNENVPVDVDNDGSNDFYVNGWNNELGFVPIFAQGCFSSPSGTATNVFGSRELTIHQGGDLLDASLNTFAFIDDDRGSAYSADTDQLANGWIDGEDRYVAFFIFTSSRFGWMRVSLDVANQKLIIKEMAYQSEYYGQIIVGHTGLVDVPEVSTKETTEVKNGNINAPVSNDNLEKEVQALSIYPNPANERVNISFDYQGLERLSIVVTNSVGKEIYRTRNNILTGEVNLDISTSTWNTGIYFVQFQTEKGIKTERLSIAK